MPYVTRQTLDCHGAPMAEIAWEPDYDETQETIALLSEPGPFTPQCGMCQHYIQGLSDSGWCDRRSELWIHDNGSFTHKKEVHPFDDATVCSLYEQSVPF